MISIILSLVSDMLHNGNAVYRFICVVSLLVFVSPLMKIFGLKCLVSIIIMKFSLFCYEKLKF